MPSSRTLKSVAEVVKEAIKTVNAEKKASEALGKVEGKTLMVTESDRTKVGQGYLGGPGFSSLQLTDPAYRDVGAVWGVAAPGKATTILNASRRVPEGEHVFTTMVGSPTQHRSNQQVFNKLLDEFRASAREGNLSDELRGRINDSLRGAITKKGKPIFAPDVDIMSPKFRKQANTFERRAIAADLIAGEGLGGKKGQIIDFERVMRRTTDPMLLDVPTGHMGPRLFTLSGEALERPDLHPAFPSILTGEDLGVAFQPAPIELMFRDFVKNLREVEGRKPGYMDITRGHGPKQFISEDLLTEMQKAGYAKGGSIDLEAEYRMSKGGLFRKAVKAIKEAAQAAAPQDEALRIAQKNAAKPVSEGGLGLRPDNTPMERAKAMGYGEPVYRGHQFGTGRNKNTFYTSSPDVASAYAVRDPGSKYEVLSGGDRYLFESLDEARAAQQGDVGGKVKKLKEAPTVQKDVLRSQKPLVVDAEGANWQFIKNPFAEPEAFEKLQRELNSVTKDKILNGRLYTADQQRADILRSNYHKVYTNTNVLAKQAKDLGYDSITIKNLNDVPTSIADDANPVSDVSIVLKPENIRSRFAAFDPARIDESDLLAGFAALGITAPMLTSEESEYRNGGDVHMKTGGIGKNVGRGMAGLTRSRQELDPKDIQAMMLDVPAGIGVPFAEAGAEYLRGNIEDAETSAAIDAALTAIPAAAVLAKPAYRAVKSGVKKAAPAARDLAREFLESGMESGAIVDPRMPVIAYHGTPHRFEKFDASKIGTGEGAQAYGHGLYFAESPEVAKEYANKLGDMPLPRIQIDPTLSNKAYTFVENSLRNSNYDKAKAIENLYKNKQLMKLPDSISAATEAINALKHGRAKAIDPESFERGVFYTVDIPDESVARMLDWDRPLEQQSAIQDLLKGTDYEVGLSAKEAEKIADERLRQEAYDWADETGGDPVDYINNANWEKYVDDVMRESGKVHSATTGEELHKMIMRDQGYSKELFDPYNYQVDTSETLRELGVPGIKYLDRASRGAGEGTRNFVVFPGEEETVKILERKKKGGAVIMKSGGKVKSAADMFHAEGRQALMDFNNKMKKRKG